MQAGRGHFIHKKCSAGRFVRASPSSARLHLSPTIQERSDSFVANLRTSARCVQDEQLAAQEACTNLSNEKTKRNKKFLSRCRCSKRTNKAPRVTSLSRIIFVVVWTAPRPSSNTTVRLL